MNEFDFVRELLDRAQGACVSHRIALKEHPTWYSGHKGKAIRAIQMAQDELQRIKRDLDEEN